MALNDIVRRIDEDARREADAVVLEAEKVADETRAEAEARAGSAHEQIIERNRAEAEAEARTRLAGARLAARDRMLAARGDLVRRALAQAVTRVEELPDAEYAALLAAHVARVARGGERVVLGEADQPRLGAHLRRALEAAGAKVEIEGATGAIERGVLLLGERMRVEISPATLVAGEADHLASIARTVLFDDTPGPEGSA